MRYLLFNITLLFFSCQNEKVAYFCQPCGLACDKVVHDGPGICPHCKMALISETELEAEKSLEINQINITQGSSMFFVEGGSDPDKVIRVRYHQPANFTRGSSVMIVLPGAGRNGIDYRNAWVEASEEYGLLVLALEYPEKYYPEFWSYNLGGMIYDVNIREDTYKITLDPSQWIFQDFDRIFNLVKEELDLTSESYDLFGHSAGGQVIHRLALFHPQSMADRIVAANSGWYTLPSNNQPFPYGLDGIIPSSEQLDFSSQLTVFLGEKDDANETRGDLRRSPEVDVQGTHRLARGQYFYQVAKELAEEREMEFNWQIHVLPNVGHDYKTMSQHAASYLYGNSPM